MGRRGFWEVATPPLSSQPKTKRDPINIELVRQRKHSLHAPRDFLFNHGWYGWNADSTLNHQPAAPLHDYLGPGAIILRLIARPMRLPLMAIFRNSPNFPTSSGLRNDPARAATRP